jgi:hypothetical protein
MQPNLHVPSTLVLGWLLFLSHLCCKLFWFPFVRDNERRPLMFIVAFESKTGCRWPRISNWPRARRIIVVSPTLRLLHPQLIVTSPHQSLPSQSPIKSIRKGTGPIVLLVPPQAHLVPKSSSNMKSPHLRAAAGAICLAPRRNWRPWEQRRREKASAMVLDGSCGHRRTWFWWSIDELMDVFVVSCAWKSTVLGMYSHKKIRLGAAHFFELLTKWWITTWCRCKLCKQVSVFNL